MLTDSYVTKCFEEFPKIQLLTSRLKKIIIRLLKVLIPFILKSDTRSPCFILSKSTQKKIEDVLIFFIKNIIDVKVNVKLNH